MPELHIVVAPAAVDLEILVSVLLQPRHCAVHHARVLRASHAARALATAAYVVVDVEAASQTERACELSHRANVAELGRIENRKPLRVVERTVHSRTAILPPVVHICECVANVHERAIVSCLNAAIRQLAEGFLHRGLVHLTTEGVPTRPPERRSAGRSWLSSTSREDEQIHVAEQHSRVVAPWREKARANLK